jgi:hypothetical protein
MMIRLKPGDTVRLLSLPTGCTSKHSPLTVGNVYVFKHYDGSNVCTTSDEPDVDAHYNKDRVEPVN